MSFLFSVRFFHYFSWFCLFIIVSLNYLIIYFLGGYVAIIDYASFSYTPELINSIVEAIGNRTLYASKSVADSVLTCSDSTFITVSNEYGTFDLRDVSQSFSVVYETKIKSSNSDYFDAAKRFVDCSKFSIGKGSTYEDVKSSIFSFMGYEMLNTLCRGSLDMFINRFNHSCNSAGNQWSVRETGRGLFGYSNSAQLLVNDIQCGVAAWGSKNGGCYVSFSGSGMAYIDTVAFYALLSSISGVQLTRVDLAQDFFDGEYTCDDAYSYWVNGGFKANRGKAPAHTWIQSNGKIVDDSVIYMGGRTLYVGDRKNGKSIRIYEKGLQLKDGDNPNWVRWEVQIGNKGRVIPLDILLKPTEYFRGAYPCLSEIVAGESCVVATKSRIYTQSIKKMIGNLSVSSAKRLCFMRDGLGMSDDAILDKLIGDTTIMDMPDHLYVAAMSKEGKVSISEAEQFVADYKLELDKFNYRGEIHRLSINQLSFTM